MSPRDSARPGVVPTSSVSQERRAHPRSSILLVTEVDVAQQDSALGLILDISSSGARLLTAISLDVGHKVDLTLHLGLDGPVHQIGGEVVRAEALAIEHRGPWTHEIAVHFDRELHGYDAELKHLAENASKLGL